MESVKRSRVEKNNEFKELRENIKTKVASILMAFPVLEERKKDSLEMAKDSISSLTKEKTTETNVNGKKLIVKANVKLTDEEKEQALIEEEKNIEEQINNQKQELENEILKVIRDNAKFVYYSKSNKDIYKYYVSAVKNPLPGKYAKIELNVLKKYIAMNKYASDELKSYLGIFTKNKTKVVSSSDNTFEDIEKIKKIDELLSKIEDSYTEKELNNLYALINELKDEKVKEELTAKADRIKRLYKNAGEVKNIFNKALQEKDLTLLEQTKDLIAKLDNEQMKADALNRLKKVTNEIKEKQEELKQQKINEANYLLEHAEKTRLEIDVEDARGLIEALDDESVKKSFKSRLDSIVISKVEDFENLVQEINNDINGNNTINEDKIIKLRELYQTLSVEDAKNHEARMNSFSEKYNKQVQDKVKENIKEENIQKHSSFSIFTELLSSSYLLKSDKLNNRKLARQEKKLEKINEVLNKEENEKKKQLIEKVKTIKEAKITKTKANIVDSDIVSGVKLFMLRNKINKLKPKLYKNDITEKQQIKLQKSLKKFSDKLSKGLNKRIDKSKEFIKIDKERIFSILNQYVELLSVTEDFDNTHEEATKFLKDINVGVLSESEIKAYETQFELMKDYKNNIVKDGNFVLNSIYESDLNETDKMIKYYDEEYPIQTHKLKYISK